MREHNPELAFRLRGHRIARGLTQEELAERAGISVRTISDVERGLRHTMYRDTAGRVAGALELEGPAHEEFVRTARGRVAAGRNRAQWSPASPMPLPPTDLIGRERDVAEVGSMLRNGARVVTITGPGGIGKTRLALEVALRHPEGEEVYFVPLADLVDPSLIGAVVAHGMGVPNPREPLSDAIGRYLQNRAALLVLDTFEHLAEAAPWVARLIAAASGLSVLVTSRSALRIRGEHELALQTLAVPSPQESSLDVIIQSPAVALFLQRARAVSPQLPEDRDTLNCITEICRRLDGLPLAIELAAARVKHLSPAALRDRLGDRLNLLVGGPKDLPARQQTMRATLAWSYDLLTGPEQVFFRRLSVFAGGWSLASSAQVCLNDPDDALELLSGLVDKSLVLVLPTDDLRYRMLEVVREFAAQQLECEPDIEGTSNLRHATYFSSLAESAEPHLEGPGQRLWLQRLEDDHENLRSALGWSVDTDQAEIALRLAGSLWRFWRMRGHVVEGRRWLESALALDLARVPPEVRNKALWGAGWLAFHQGDFGRARSLGLQLQSTACNNVEVRNALTIIGHVDLAEGNAEEAVRRMRQALDRCANQQGTWLFATSVMNLGIATAHSNLAAPARKLLEEACRLYEEQGDEYFVARAKCYLAFVALLEGQLREALSLTAAALRISVDLQDEWGIAEGLEWMAAVAVRSDAGLAGLLAGAATRLREALSLQQMPCDAAAIEEQIADARLTPQWAEQTAKGRRSSLGEVLQAAFAEQPVTS
jgi:predicted ATPase/transcriptional regulator with XRE-family HTH domain